MHITQYPYFFDSVHIMMILFDLTLLSLGCKKRHSVIPSSGHTHVLDFLTHGDTIWIPWGKEGAAV